MTKSSKRTQAPSLPQPNRTIEMVSPRRLSPYAGNARTHSQQQIAQIAASITLTGFVGSILAQRDGTIIAGHGRLEAAKLLGLAKVPVTYLDHLDEKEVRAFRIADNRLAEKAGWCQESLRIEFAELRELDLDFDLSITGFEHAEIDLIIDGAQVDDAAERESISDPKGPAVSRSGDIWLLGPHRLMCGSALNSDNMERLLAGATAAMVFTDPPYNVPIAGHVSGLGRTRHREFSMAAGEMSKAEFTHFLVEALAAHAAAASEGAILFVCMDWRHLEELLSAARTCGLELINLCVWNKTNGGMGSLYRSKHELVVVLKKGDAPHINNIQLGRFGRYRTNVWDYAGVNGFGRDRAEDLANHPTVKPVALVADAIRDVSNRGDVVLDGFMGSGTSLLAAERTGRICLGMEIDSLYADLAIRRWQELTGRLAVLELSGDIFDSVARERGVTAETEER